MKQNIEKEGVTFVYHMFGPNETVNAIIKKYNHQNIQGKILEQLINRYNILNGEEIPRLGSRVKIPLFVGFVGMPQRQRSYQND